ncbi:HEPN domain-containing protein [Siphonobacter curvatus]|uniref:Uncharacterized protein n=1 Tax=Siphonobacter curvatus TaxID=2094562 RepID=A0A2S7IQ22_9BACT|nr:HEPN domain-containing protein [Siphonobacter curvatus]PQA59823.1 hypothetical protein C5O19_09435 [Siphonobacter curvatus]
MSATPQTTPNHLVEYLIKLKGDTNYCTTIETFNRFLTSDGSIVIENNLIKFKGIEINYTLKSGPIPNKSKIYYHLIFKCPYTSDIEIYLDFLKHIKTLLALISDSHNILTLWDDTSFYYAQKSYPLIHEIENLMRKLFTKFMVINLDTEWSKSRVPSEIKAKSEYKQSGNSDDYLYQTDFIHLKTFLSTEITTPKSQDLYSKIKKANTLDELNLEELKSFIPVSNWDKYFKSIISCDLDFITSRWDELYQLRCKVAHNNFLNKAEYQTIIRLFEDLKPKISQAIESLDSIEVDESDAKVITENIESSIEESNTIPSGFVSLNETLENLYTNKYIDVFLFTKITEGLIINPESIDTIENDSIKREMLQRAITSIDLRIERYRAQLHFQELNRDNFMEKMTSKARIEDLNQTRKKLIEVLSRFNNENEEITTNVEDK